MGLLDYYRQFEDVDERELNKERRERRHRERALALEQVPDLDLSGTEWPEFPNSEVMNASIYTARGRVNGYPDRHAEDVRRALAEAHDVEPERIAVGNGAAELLQAAALVLLGEGDELLTPWPSYPLYPLMAARAGGRPVPVDVSDGGLEQLRAAVTDRTRLVVLCNPNDPTGHLLLGRADRVAGVRAPGGRPRGGGRGAGALPGRRGRGRRAAAHRRPAAPDGGAHVLEDLRAVGAAGRLRGGLLGVHLAARLDRPGAGRERPHPVGDRAGAEDRRARRSPAAAPP